MNDADQIVVLKCKGYEQQTTAGRKPDDNIPAFILGMPLVEKFDPVGIVKSVCGLIESDLMFVEVSLCFVVIPGKAAAHKNNIHMAYTPYNARIDSVTEGCKSRTRTWSVCSRESGLMETPMFTTIPIAGQALDSLRGE